MIIDNCQSADDTAKQLLQFISYRPFQWGGTWFVSAWNGVGYCCRSMRALKTLANKAGLETIEVIKIN